MKSFASLITLTSVVSTGRVTEAVFSIEGRKQQARVSVVAEHRPSQFARHTYRDILCLRPLFVFWTPQLLPVCIYRDQFSFGAQSTRHLHGGACNKCVRSLVSYPRTRPQTFLFRSVLDFLEKRKVYRVFGIVPTKHHVNPITRTGDNVTRDASWNPNSCSRIARVAVQYNTLEVLSTQQNRHGEHNCEGKEPTRNNTESTTHRSRFNCSPAVFPSVPTL